MSVYTPLRVPGAQILQEERNVVDCIPRTSGVARVIALGATGWVQVWLHFHRTVGRCLVLASEVEHIHSRWVMHTHHLHIETFVNLRDTGSYYRHSGGVRVYVCVCVCVCVCGEGRGGGRGGCPA